MQQTCRVASALVLALALVPALVGCGGRGRSGPGPGEQARQTVGPHGGVAVRLAEQGYAELVAESSGGSNVLAVYLLGTDLKTPLASRASSVSAELLAAGGPQSFQFQPKPGADPSGANRYEATAGTLTEDRFDGKLKIELDGQVFDLTISPY